MNSVEKFTSALEAYVTLITMGHTKVQEVTEEGQTWKDVDVVQFSVVMADIFEDIKQATALKARFITDAKGNKDFDAYTVTQDEHCWFLRTLLEGGRKISNRLSYLSKGVAVPFLFDEGVLISDYDPALPYAIGQYVKDPVNKLNIYLCIQNIAEGQNESLADKEFWVQESPLLDTKGKVVFNIRNNWKTPDNAFMAMNNNIRASLKYYVLAEWYRIPGLQQEVMTWEGKYLEELTWAIKNSHQRCVPIKRAYDPRP